MKQELSPLSIVLILSYFALLGVLGFWANDKELQIAGPVSVKQFSNGDPIIQVGNSLYRTTKRGDDVKHYDLEKLGVDHLFDYVLLDDDTIIVRLGSYEKSTSENIADYLRLPNTKTSETPTAKSGLFRCSLDTFQCRLYSNNYDPDDVHWFSYDYTTKELFVADVTRHQIHKINAHGEKVATEGDEFIFPNSMLIDGDDLYVVDTNHKRIKTVRRTDKDFGRLIKQFIPVTGVSKKAGHKYPYMMITTGPEFWVMNMDREMRHGGIYRFNKDWSYAGSLKLPVNSDIAYMATLGKEVWLTDAENSRILKYDLNGEFIKNYTSHELERIFNRNRADKSEYALIAKFMLWLFFISIGVGVLVGIWQMWKSSPFAKFQTQPEVHININDPNIIWLRKNESMQRKTYLLVSLVVIMLLLTAVIAISFMAGTTKEVTVLPFLLPIGFISVIMLVLFRMFYQNSMGVCGEILILKRGKKYHAARNGGIYYSGSHIAINDIIMPLQVGAIQYFHVEDVIQHLNPIITNTTILKMQEMNLYQIKHTPKWVWAAGIGFLIWMVIVKLMD